MSARRDERGRRRGRPSLLRLAPGVLLPLLLLAGCIVDFPEQGHDRCLSDDDCIEGRVCSATSRRCVAAGTPEPDALDALDALDAETSGDAPADLDDAPDDTRPQDTDGDSTPADTGDTAQPDTSGPDGDGDGVPNASDNCRDDPNPLQEDHDANGVGDLCQPAQHSALVITEVMADPEQGVGPDGTGNLALEWRRQYVEIHNAGPSAVDLSGYVLENGAGVQVEISPGSPAVVAPGGIFVVSGGAIAGPDGVTPVAGAAHGSASFVLDDGAGGDGLTAFETISLLRPLMDRPQAPFLADRVTFSQRFLRGTSRALSWSVASGLLPAQANDERGDWCDAGRAPGPGRDGGSPGAANGPCYDPLVLRCGEPAALELDAYAFGDLTDVRVAADNNNVCSPPQHGPALARDLTWRVELASPTEVELRFDPVPTVVGNQETGAGLALEPWYAMVYWREGVCPSEPPVFDASLCLEPSDGAVRSTVQLEAGVAYYFTVDGQNRNAAGAFEEGRFTFGLFAVP